MIVLFPDAVIVSFSDYDRARQDCDAIILSRKTKTGKKVGPPRVVFFSDVSLGD